MSSREPKSGAAVTEVLKQRVVVPLIDQIRQGVTPERIALALSLGAILGVFPILGASTLLCVMFGAALHLNQPAMQLANYLVYPIQIPLIFVFVRFGESLLHARHVSFSVPQLMARAQVDPEGFVRQFGMTGLHAILAWSLIALPALILMYALLRPLMRIAARRAEANDVA